MSQALTSGGGLNPSATKERLLCAAGLTALATRRKLFVAHNSGRTKFGASLGEVKNNADATPQNALDGKGPHDSQDDRRRNA